MRSCWIAFQLRNSNRHTSLLQRQLSRRNAYYGPLLIPHRELSDDNNNNNNNKDEVFIPFLDGLDFTNDDKEKDVKRNSKKNNINNKGNKTKWSFSEWDNQKKDDEIRKGKEKITKLFQLNDEREKLSHSNNNKSVDKLKTQSIFREIDHDVELQRKLSNNKSDANLVDKRKFLDYDEDEDRGGGKELMPDNASLATTTDGSSSGSGGQGLSEFETLEQELLDDDFSYFATINSSTAQGQLWVPADPSSGAADANSSSRGGYVPGMQIIAPGLTRYRLDVQYKGSCFNGWFKHHNRQSVKKVVMPDGSVEYRTLSPSEKNRNIMESGTSGYDDDGSNSNNNNNDKKNMYFVKLLLEEAIAVAVDIPTSEVHIIPSVFPESGVSVQCLPCHVDLPSTIEMQSRTIIQRATLWLVKKLGGGNNNYHNNNNINLAILSMYPCVNQDFHARHTALKRIYCYTIVNRIAPPVFGDGLCWHVDRKLDAQQMQKVANCFIGTMDFGYFVNPKMLNALQRAAAHGHGSNSSGGITTRAYSEASDLHDRQHDEVESSQSSHRNKVKFAKGMSNLQRAAALPTINHYGQTIKTFQGHYSSALFTQAQTNLPTVRTMDHIEVVRHRDEIKIWFEGKNFMRHQIRHMVSVLRAAGLHLWGEQEVRLVLKKGLQERSEKQFLKNRLPPAPPEGLVLYNVEYPSEHEQQQRLGSEESAVVSSGPFEEVFQTE